MVDEVQVEVSSAVRYSINPVVTGIRTVDVCSPTSERLEGSDAMNHDPDYSAAYDVLETDRPRLEGHGLTFTIGRGNELCVAAIDFRYLTDCITPDEALALLTEPAEGKAGRVDRLLAEGYLCYTTSTGWLGYPDGKLRRLA